MLNLDQKISAYSEEVFLDLGLASLAEDEKAEIYARIQDHLHEFLLKNLSEVCSGEEIEKITFLLEQEDYEELNRTLDTHPAFKQGLEAKLDGEFAALKNTIASEQKNAQAGQV